MEYRKSSRSFREMMVFCVGVLFVSAQLVVPPLGSVQTSRRLPVSQAERNVLAERAGTAERAAGSICEQRGRDPLSTAPIDQMANTRPLPLTDRRVLARRSRAQKLLPIAKRLVPFALRRVAAKNGLEPLSLRWITDRVQEVNTVRAEVEERDNASWRAGEPDSIIFGTVFLVGLRSDEAMIAVLGHELTHAVNATDRGLQPVFASIRAKAFQMGTPVSEAAAVELGCELVGLEVLRDYVSQTGGRGRVGRRLARAFQKDCVQRELADENHLSPRETMLLLLKFEPEVAGSIAGNPRVGRQVRQTRRRRR
jgi:hypothetical protein